MTDNEITKAFDVLEKMEFFGGQRAGRELWFNKPIDIQNKDIGKFLRDIDFLKTFINSQQAEIERLQIENQSLRSAAVSYSIHYNKARAEAAREFAERLKEKLQWDVEYDNKLVFESDIDNLVKEMVGDTE